MPALAIVQHQPSVPPGLIADALEQRGVDHFVLEAWHEQAWPHAEELRGLIVLGGVMNVDEVERYEFLGRSRSLMSAALEAEVPTMGVCLGAQIMARVLGGDVVRAERRNALFSPLKVLTDDPVVDPFKSGAPVLQFHEDTFTIPPDGVPLATSEASGLHQAFRYGRNAYAIQFHFEVDEAIVRAWCEDIGDDEMSASWNTSTADLLTETRAHVAAQERAGRALIDAFLTLRR